MSAEDREALESRRRERGLPSRIVQEIENEGEFQAGHTSAGRASQWPMGCVTFCACGAAFFRDDAAESDQAQSAHQLSREGE